MFLADMHIHALYGVDDGARTKEEMINMVRQSYEDGVRVMCLTPHYHPGQFGDNRRKVVQAYAELSEYVKETIPKLLICLGNELRYDNGAAGWLTSGDCHTINGTDFVLVDFLAEDDYDFITEGVRRIANTGYRPVLAHAERYQAFFRDRRTLAAMRADGVIIQLDAGSLLGDYGRAIKKQSQQLMDKGLVDIVSSDSHRPEGSRYCSMKDAAEFIEKKYGTETAENLCRKNIMDIIYDRL